MKLDIFKSQWLDLVFEGRNKKYGAYELRKENPKTSVKALFGGAFVFAFAIGLPMLLDMIPASETKSTLDEKVVLVNIEKPKVDPLKPPPPPPEPPKPKIDEVKFVAPKVVAKERVVEEIKTIDELKDKNIAAKDQKGDRDAKIVIDQPTGDGEKDAEIVDNTIYNSAGIEVQPGYPGGMDKFGGFIKKNFNTDDIASKLSSDLNGKVIVKFVVEKDGSLTDIEVIRDLGYGTKEEAIRVLRKGPKWTPGIQNGKPVRTNCILPINLSITAGE
ncbi:energy transducer TonB [Flavobacterium psychrophilum]|uniref:Energy transducer TonB n=1 Tax=Flavobacterium psychrophilum TaxID=96345 RepID=A0A7U2RAZ3_FLAPS|nr:energy transducer TonB [Flavobacterium psychrophilum]EKT3963562.1 energy transducer TonB [Flavobacterium psychrophilum]EKT4516953.1 energy transducer TonB [Flavobacterium psychrophilum]ELM3644702.1 energy transducer TonB [Flavobacterium psychrophilum]ELY1979044.1 energy transducer TonB [Flavobacterium psychrophilum]MBF2091349.1 energy transducer TonB [Flavobacterium psychrophilum]